MRFEVFQIAGLGFSEIEKSEIRFRKIPKYSKLPK